MTLDPHTLAEQIRQTGEHERKVIVRLLLREFSVPHTNKVFDSSSSPSGSAWLTK